MDQVITGEPVSKGMFMERKAEAPEQRPAGHGMSDGELLDLFKKCKKESFEHRWIWERGWMRNIHYVNNRHWIVYNTHGNAWRDVRLAKWVPKPVTTLVTEGVQALRAMFQSVNLGVNVRPNGADPKNVAVAAIADEYAPVLHEEHDMDAVLDEADFWFIVTGNVFLHTYLERDAKHGFHVIPFEQCVECNTVYSTDMIAEAGQMCPDCGGNQFVEATSPETGEPMEKRIPKGKGVTAALSPFELAFPNSYARFSDVPYVIRLRWRTKEYYENHPTLKAQVADVKWSKAPSEQALQLFRSLPFHNDMGVAPFLNTGGGADSGEEGAPEYEMWMRPCDAYPKGLVVRVLGDSDPIVLHLEDEEAIPGEIPYVDAEGNPMFPFTHAPFEQRGGRVYGTSPLDAVIQKVNQLNQLDSLIQMIIQRVANPLWLVPKGAEIEKFTGEPGLVVKWNPLTVGGNAKPERVDGVGPNAGLFKLRELYKQDIEQGLGTYDVLKGSKPAGVEAFSALQLMVERAQSRFGSAFKARGGMYKDWFKFALEIEREFGEDSRTRAVMSPARTWTMEEFKNAQLQGCFSVVVEDGSTTPKTTLGTRAAVQHLQTLGALDLTDPDQRFTVLQLFGQTKLAPSLDIHMQAALRKQQNFEDWAQNPEAQQQSLMKAQEGMQKWEQEVASVQPPPPVEPQIGPDGMPIPVDPMQEEQAMAAAIPPPPSINANTPLKWLPWYDAAIHKQEFLKWTNSDRMVEMLEQNPALEQLLVAHLEEIDAAIQQKLMLDAGPQIPAPGGAGMAMANSNNESGGAQNASNPGGKHDQAI